MIQYTQELLYPVDLSDIECLSSEECEKMYGRKIFSLVIIILLIPFSCCISVAAQSDHSFIVDSLYSSEEVSPDPYLDHSFSFHVAGQSSEFSYSIEQDSDLSNIAFLNWTHRAGTALEYDNEPNLPLCLEYVYLSQGIQWDHEVLPTALNISVDHQVNATGNFLEDNWPGMFEIQVWFITDENPRWVAARFYWGHYGFQERFSLIDLSSIEFAFAPFLEPESSEVKIAIALVPSWRFYDNFGSQPWQYYNGSVILQIRAIHVNALYRKSTTLPSVRTTLSNNTWRLGDSDRFQESEVGANQDLYLLSYQEANGNPSGTTLTRVNMWSEVIWQKSWNSSNAIFWRDLATSGSRIYLISEIENQAGTDILVASYSYEGELMNEWTYDFETIDFAGQIDVGFDGSIYLGIYTTSTLKRNSLVKLDSTGDVKWIEPFGFSHFDIVNSLQTDKKGYIYTLTDSLISKFDTNGTIVWEMDGFNKDIFVLQDGSVILTSSSGLIVNLTRVNQDGLIQWSFKSQFRYTPSWGELFYATSFSEGPNGLLYALYATYGYHSSSIVVILRSDGSQLENYTVAFSNEAYSGFDVPRFRKIHITEDNLIFLVGRIMDEDWKYEITISTFGAEELILGIPTTTFLSTISAVVAITLVVIVLQSSRSKTWK